MDSTYKTLIVRDWLDYDLDSADLELYLKLKPSLVVMTDKSVIVELP